MTIVGTPADTAADLEAFEQQELANDEANEANAVPPPARKPKNRPSSATAADPNPTGNSQHLAGDISNDNEDDSDEDDEPEMDTMVDEIPVEGVLWDRAKGIEIAPAEGNRPLGWWHDVHAIPLSYPTIFAGQTMPTYQNQETGKNLSFMSVARWMFRNKDTRAARNTSFLFSMLRMIHSSQLLSSANVKLRKTFFRSSGGKQAKDVRTQAQQEDLANSPAAFRDFRPIRNSPGYWQSCKTKLFAMLRQLGAPTWFLTLSAADTEWKDYIQHLHKSTELPEVKNKPFEELTKKDVNNLIRENPVLAARLMRHRLETVFTEVLQKTRVLGRLVDYYWRDEFQNRGSVHNHSLLWAENAPTWKPHHNDQEVCAYVDKYLTCSSEAVEPELIRLQIHKHRRCLKRKGDTLTCRYGYPLPPMRRTSVIYPLEMPSDTAKADWKTIRSMLHTYKDTDLNFDAFLALCGMDDERYNAAIQCAVRRPTVWLRRTLKDVWVNSYNPDLLKLWRANMDLQFCLDPWAAGIYIASYMLKSMKGLSSLMREAVKSTKRGNYGVKEALRLVGNVFVSAHEVCAQEAVYIATGMRMNEGSRSTFFIDTNPPSERQHISKSSAELFEMADDSEDIMQAGLVQQYACRMKLCTDWPKDVDLKNMCLADFGALYTRRFVKANQDEIIGREDSTEEQQPRETEADSDQANGFEGRKFTLHARRHSAVFWSRRYNKMSDPQNHMRELLMLYVPWQAAALFATDDEEHAEHLHGFGTYQEALQHYKEMIDATRSKYEQQGVDWDRIQADCDAAEGFVDGEQMSARVRMERCAEDEYDLGLDMGGVTTTAATIRANTQYMDHMQTDAEYYENVAMLNEEQRAFFDHFLYNLYTNKTTHEFLTGGAGVGKSLLTRCIIQAVFRYGNAQPGSNPDQPPVMIIAPTGTAAFNVNGLTIHKALEVPANHNLNAYVALGPEKANALRTRWGSVKVVVIDEISMVGHRMFNYVDQRLRQIKGRPKTPFGGTTVLVVGDFYQLSPVGDGFVFAAKTSKNPDNIREADLAALAPSIWYDMFYVYELQQIMRQKDAAEFAALLNRLRVGEQTNADRALISTRDRSKDHPDYSITYRHITYTNKRKDVHNRYAYDHTPGEALQYTAVDTPVSHMDEQTAAMHINEAKTKPVKESCLHPRP